MHLDSFGNGMAVAVFGASGGIGGALVRILAADPSVSTVLALSRGKLDLQLDNVESVFVDFADPDSIDRAAAHASAFAPLDLVIIATGVLHVDDAIRPEKSLQEIDAQAMSRVFQVNTVGPTLAAARFLPYMRKGRKTVLAALSARVGSIGDNRLGGWVSYRASKAALNMAMRTCAIEQARRNRESIVAALHPGTVSTRLSAPFSRRVPADKLFSPDRAATQLLQVIDGLTPADSGGFFAWDGTRIEY